MQIKLSAADALRPPQLHAAFRTAFADYLIGPFELAFEQWPGFLARQGIALELSRAALSGDELLAFALVAPRSDCGRWRLGTMGAVPAARGTGAAAALLDEMIERAVSHGIEAIELEVFAQNERAVRLYRSRGFEVLHELHGYEVVAPAVAESASQAAGSSVDVAAAFAWLVEAAAAIGNLPLQVLPPALASAASALQAWQTGSAQLIARADAADGTVVIHSLVDRDPRQHDAETLVRALMTRHPGRTIKVPALQRSDVGGMALTRSGLQTQPLHQWLMLRSRAVRSSGRLDQVASTGLA